MRNQADAEDAVQDAYVRAIRHYAGFRGGDARAWLLAIVRNSCYDKLRSRSRGAEAVFDESIHSVAPVASPESLAMASESAHQVRQALEELPLEYREVFVLREMEQLSYAEIAEVAGIPVGTVMSRLSRARERLREKLRRPPG